MAPKDAKRLAMIEDVEFLLSCGVGEAAILESTGYTRNPLALQRTLYRAHRRDLIPRIFEWQAQVEEQQHPKTRTRKE